MKENNTLMLALDELDRHLDERSLQVELFICGAFAIQMYGYIRSLHTHDVDTLKEISSAEVLSMIKEVGEKLGLGPRWLNDQASTVSLPTGIFERAKPIMRWKAIKARLIDRSDLIMLKASAFAIRRDVTAKDWDDLVLLKPTQKEIEDSIRFLKETNSPPVGASQKIVKDFKDTLDELKKLVD